MNKPKRDKKEEATEEAAGPETAWLYEWVPELKQAIQKEQQEAEMPSLNRIKKQADEQHLLNKTITESALGWQASSLGL